jgi:hypothetical protein
MKAVVCGVLLVRINLAWAVGANSCVRPRDSFKLLKEKNEEKGQLPSTDFYQFAQASTGRTTTCLSSLSYSFSSVIVPFHAYKDKSGKAACMQ